MSLCSRFALARMAPMTLALYLVPLLGLALYAGAQPLVDFQVAQPPPLPQDAKQCTIQILQYVCQVPVSVYMSDV